MFAAKKFLRKLSEFRKDQSGTVLTTTAISLLVLLTAAGAAVDYSRIANTHSKMTNALDSALLAAGIEFTRGTTDRAELQEIFQNFFEANLNGRGETPTDFSISEFTVDQNTGRIAAQVDTEVTATLMQVAGFDNLEVSASGAGTFDTTDVEIAMMLDVTGSMQGQKIADLRLAASDAVRILLPNNNTRGVRIGLVPYASSINADRYASDVTRGNTSPQVASLGQFTTSQNVPTNRCVTGRGGRDATTDAFFDVAPLGSDRRTVNPPTREAGCPNARIQPLTNNRNQLLNQIDRYVAEGATAGHLGVAWSYYLLSENWRDLYNPPNRPANFSDDVQKIAILMTDGEFNTAFEGIDGTGDFAPFGGNDDISNARARALCEDMKRTRNGNPGITIYAIAFEAPASAQATLQDCANEDTSQTTFYFEAESGAELRQAFREIAASISTVRISE